MQFTLCRLERLWGLERAAWFESVIQCEASSRHILISHEEVNAIADIVNARYGRFSGRAAKALSGHDISAYLPERLLQPVSDEIYEALMVNIDHQISSTLDTVKRSCLIRDKVMFAAGRQLRLNQGRLANLTLEQVRTLAPNFVKLDFYDVPRTPDQARAWIVWYWKKIRGNLHPKEDVYYVFTSASTGRSFRHSTIGAIFNKLVEAANLQNSIRSYSYWVKDTI